MSKSVLQSESKLDPKTEALLVKRLPEMRHLERVCKQLPEQVKLNVETTITHAGIDFPIYSIVLGTEDRTAPTLGIFGGVHGLERIGSEVAIAWLQTTLELLTWDQSLRDRLKTSRLVFMPLINPVGMYLTRRSNGNGVDLMRNSPVRAEQKPAFLLGGQTYSPKIPWYQGNSERLETMEAESQAVYQVVQRELFPARVSLSVDVHSGFGSVDRLWFPYAKTVKPPPHLAEITAITKLFDRTYPNHFYKIEPQAKSYTTHGDLWDWLYDLHPLEQPGNLFVPWALELGSWLWLKKNPRQIFSSLGAFNPLMPHRRQRILRRHYTLFDFLHRALMSSEPWSGLDAKRRAMFEHRGKELWYE